MRDLTVCRVLVYRHGQPYKTLRVESPARAVALAQLRNRWAEMSGNGQRAIPVF